MTLEMDFDAVVEYELEHPEWSIMSAIGTASASNRISDMNLIVGFLRCDGQRMEPDYIAYLRSGHTVKEMLDTFREGLTLLGFISEDGPSAE